MNGDPYAFGLDDLYRIRAAVDAMAKAEHERAIKLHPRRAKTGHPGSVELDYRMLVFKVERIIERKLNEAPD